MRPGLILSVLSLALAASVQASMPRLAQAAPDELYPQYELSRVNGHDERLRLIARIPEPTGGIHEYMLDPDALTDDDLSDLLRAMEHYGPGGQSMHRSLISMLSPRLRLGVRVMPLSDALARALHAPDSHGLLVTAVVPGSPAMRAGISPGDVLLSLKGQALESAFHLEGRLNVLAGEIALGLLRAGVHEERIANLGPLPTREAPGGGLGGPGGR